MNNSQEFNESKVVRFLLKYEFDEGKLIYSNFSGAVYFFTREITLPAPHSAKNRNDLDYLKTHFQDWPDSGDAYLIFFLPNYWRFYYTPQELSTIAELTEIFTSKDGGIYLVRQR